MLCIRLLELCGVQQCYLADLDLIVGQRPQRSGWGSERTLLGRSGRMLEYARLRPWPSCSCRKM
jgi:hypothetical protein